MKKYEKIQVLSEIEHIRKRPSMYIGDTRTPIHLLNELIDNAIDELSLGANTLKVSIFDEGFSVYDDGRGFPQSENEELKIPHAVVAFVKLHSGAKFSKESYSTSIGLHGIGLTAVNALCRRVEVRTARDGKLLSFSLVNGELEDITYEEKSDFVGTEIKAYPDKQFFDSLSIDKKKIEDKLSLVRLLLGDKKIFLDGEEVRGVTEEDLLGETETGISKIEVVDKEKEESLTIFFGYAKGTSVRFEGSVNLLPCSKGLHLRLFEKALQDAWLKFLGKDKGNLQPTDFLIGYRAFVLIKIEDPSYSSQTKEYLTGSIEKHELLLKNTTKAIVDWIENLPSKIQAGLVAKFREFRDAIDRMSLDKLIEGTTKLGKERKVQVGSKLVDCTNVDPKDTELFICEGDSAGGTLIKMRDPRIHAILPLRGKILNIAGTSTEKALSNKEINNMVTAIGTGVGKKFDENRLRYGKIIIATDPDVDGAQIRALVLGAIAKLLPRLIEMEKVYILEVPLFGYVKNKKFFPVFEMDQIPEGVARKRMKGLGSFNPEELKSVALDKQTRRLTLVTKDGLEKAVSLVGSASERKSFLIECGLIV